MVQNANEAMFKQSTSIYKQPQEISNVGTMAIWDERMSQLTLLSNNYMFLVHVKVSNNAIENKKKLLRLPTILLKKYST
jgi:hypothetical protein